MSWVSWYLETCRELGVEEAELQLPPGPGRGVGMLVERYTGRVHDMLTTWFTNILEVPPPPPASPLQAPALPQRALLPPGAVIGVACAALHSVVPCSATVTLKFSARTHIPAAQLEYCGTAISLQISVMVSVLRGYRGNAFLVPLCCIPLTLIVIRIKTLEP